MSQLFVNGMNLDKKGQSGVLAPNSQQPEIKLEEVK
jgi:hypothetical protein